MAAKLIDYTIIRDDYVCGVEREGIRYFPSLGELAKKYRVAYSTVANASSRENWAKQREDYQRQLQEKVLEARKERDDQYMIRASEFDAICVQVSVMGMGEVKRSHKQAKEQNLALDHNKNQTLARTALDYQKLGRIALGLPIDGKQVTNTSRIDGLDLSKLTEKELEVLNKIAERVEARERQK